MLYSDVDYFSRSLVKKFDHEMSDLGLRGTFGVEIEFYVNAASRKAYNDFLFLLREKLYYSDIKYHRFNQETGELRRGTHLPLAEVSTRKSNSASEAIGLVLQTKSLINSLATSENVEIIESPYPEGSTSPCGLHIHFGIEKIDTGENCLIVPNTKKYNKIAEIVRLSVLDLVTNAGISTLFYEDEQASRHKHKKSRLGKSPAPVNIDAGIKANKGIPNPTRLGVYGNPNHINHYYTDKGLDSGAGMIEITHNTAKHLEYKLPGASPFSCIPMVGLTSGILEGMKNIGRNTDFSERFATFREKEGDLRKGRFPEIKDLSYRSKTMNHRNSLLWFLEDQHHTCGSK